MREVCWTFSTKSSTFTENPLSTAACSRDKVNTILKTVQHFLYLTFPWVRSTKNESKRDFFSSKRKKASLCSFWPEETSWKYLFLASTACFGMIRFKLYILSTSLSKWLTHFCLSDTMLPSESKDGERATWYLSGQRFWTFWTNTTILCLVFFRKDRFFSLDRSVNCNEDFVAVKASLIHKGEDFQNLEGPTWMILNWN